MLKSLFTTLLLLTLFSCQQTESKKNESKKPESRNAEPIVNKRADEINTLSNEKMIIETKHGAITLKFYPNAAPKTVARISELVEKGFYNGLTFHRVIPNFVAQGGDPKGNGTGGSGTKIDAEFNSIPHELGTLSMARSSDPNSADSQFYICLARLPHLDNQYTVFGKVVDGMDAVMKIQPNDRMEKVYLK